MNGENETKKRNVSHARKKMETFSVLSFSFMRNCFYVPRCCHRQSIRRVNYVTNVSIHFDMRVVSLSLSLSPNISQPTVV